MNIHDLPQKWLQNLWNFPFGFFTNHNIWSFLNNTSHFEIGAWNFWYFNIENKPLAFLVPYISIQESLSLFPSQILVCATGFCSSLSLFILRFTFGELFCKNIKIKWEEIYVQVYASIKTIKTVDQLFMTSLKIYLQQSHIVFKISPTKIYVHTKQAKLINVLRH